MSDQIKPALWLIFIITGLPILSETVYTPSLPEISKRLGTTESMTEYTLTIFLLGFALGIFFWGKLSDRLGRKPCLILGILIYIIGCISCYFSDSIHLLLISRFIQAFGGSAGSVLSQAACRDAFHGPALGKAYSTIGAALPIFPAIGPVVGGVIAEHFDWTYIFSILAVLGTLLCIVVIFYMPETNPKHQRTRVSLKSVVLHLIKDKKVLVCALIVGGCQGISFSYFAEGSFYLIELLGLSPSHYGASFIMIAGSAAMGAMCSRQLHSKAVAPETIMSYGLRIIFSSTLMFSISALFINYALESKSILIYITILSQMGVALGMSMAINNALAIALTEYKWCTGTASSLFGFSYYIIISICTLIMGMLHNGTILPMPLYFLTISSLMILIKNIIKR